MPYPIDPASLEGDELDRWYRRSPQEIERERQIASARQYAAFFGPTEPELASSGAAAQGTPSDDRLYIATGTGGVRAIRPGASDFESTLAAPGDRPNDLPANPAAPEEADLIEIGNPHNRRLRREWVRANSRPWPKTADGRNYHVAHGRAIADGGTNTLDNIEPMHPDEHIAQHLNNGDSARWARRGWIARAFGGVVEPPTPGFRANGLRANGLGLLGLLPDISGALVGRIRTDTPVHFWYDLAGVPAPGDKDLADEAICRSMGITTPGAKCA
jgi:hypothetical protein